jgi:DJ-1 family protein
MKEAFIFLAEGFEETEAIATIDVIRRAEIKLTSVSISDDYLVKGAHDVWVKADRLFPETDFSNGSVLVLPGGMPGAANLNNHAGLKKLLKEYAGQGKKIAAICAAPLVLGGLGLLQGKNATAYPGFEATLVGAEFIKTGVVIDGNIITGRGPGFAVDFGLAIVSQLVGSEKADEVAAGMLLA